MDDFNVISASDDDKYVLFVVIDGNLIVFAFGLIKI